jgi:hypothetical protein
VNCADFFGELDALEDGSKRGEKLRSIAHSTLLDWQRETASPHSPGPVTDGEMLRLALYDGRQVVGGELHRNAFSPLMALGLSTDRCGHATTQQSMSRAQQKSERDGKTAWGYVEIAVALLRSMKVPETRHEAIGVYDTAIAGTPEREGNLSHAEGFMLVKTSNSVPLKSLQADLLDEYRAKLKRWSDE